MRHVLMVFLLLQVACGCLLSAARAETPLRVYIDADRWVHLAAAEAIRMGAEAALALADGRAGGRPIEIVPLDHRGNVKRSHLHMQRYLEDETAIAMIGGAHSPPYLEWREYINQQEILLLLPWSAAGPITRPEGPSNWIFRLSVDDTKAGRFLVENAIEARGCRAVALVLLDTGWGRYNRGRMTEALRDLGMSAPRVYMFPGSVGAVEVRSTVRTIAETGADCAILVSTSRESVSFVRSFAELAPGIKISSHWGIAAGGFVQAVDYETREAVGLRVLHTCFQFDSDMPTPMAQKVSALARKLFPDQFETLQTLPAAVGFVHAFDATRLLLAAIDQAGVSDDIRTARREVRAALEALETPVEGLIRTYRAPFGAYRRDLPDAHEALGARDLCMIAYGQEGEIVMQPGLASVRDDEQ